ncbi:hypothetical protein HU200_013964 [Digitaria exilis]|uniref:Uncharacterized protein n=1 Tax=Digitaria exilis TaxID=1010633 RepID=A0A835FCD5_9POAL|nr:hypothetical protein HU200_013964 [Digitaria exilis]
MPFPFAVASTQVEFRTDATMANGLSLPVPGHGEAKPARPDAAPFRIIIYRPFFPPVPSRMKIVVAARPVVNSSLAAAVFRTDRRLTCMHRYLRSVVSPCGGKRIRTSPHAKVRELGDNSSSASQARCPPRRATLNHCLLATGLMRPAEERSLTPRHVEDKKKEYEEPRGLSKA